MTITNSAHAYQWDDLDTDHPMPGVARERIIGSQVMISRVHLDAGCVVPTHSHANEQMACIVSGRIRFTLGDDQQEQRVLGPGEVLHIPANVRHGAEALELCEILDVFSPPSETTGVDHASR